MYDVYCMWKLLFVNRAGPLYKAGVIIHTHRTNTSTPLLLSLKTPAAHEYRVREGRLNVSLCFLSSTASRAVSCSLFQGWGLRHTFQVAYVCSFLFQAVFWQISSPDQALVPAPKLPVPTQGVIMSLHTCYCLRCPCYVIMRSQLTFLHTPFASSVFRWVNKDFYLFNFIIADCDLRNVCAYWLEV